MSEDLQPIARRKAIELEHDRRIKGRDVAMPDVARNAGEEDVSVATLESLWHRQFGDAVFLAKIFAQEQTVYSGRIAAHDHVLVDVGKNLRLHEVTRAEHFRDRAGLANAAKR